MSKFHNIGIKNLRIFITRPFFVAASHVLYQRVQWEKAHAMAPLSCVCLRHNFIIALSTAGVDNVIFIVAYSRGRVDFEIIYYRVIKRI